MTRDELYGQIRAKRSFLCVGLDTDLKKIPAHLRGGPTPLFDFNRAIIDATAPYAVAFKPNLAFYEAHGADGVAQFEATCRYIRERYPEILIIADAKRGDIGNTSEMYARAFFDAPSPQAPSTRGIALADAVTLSPYMGRDTVEPFLRHDGRWAVILALTSNPGADDFETLRLFDGRPLWKHVLETAAGWGTPDNTMFVVGATRAEMLAEVREVVPGHFLLVPGVGAQGGSLSEVARHGMNSRCGLLVNSSRAIIYASSAEDFASAAAAEAKKTAAEMSTLLPF
ncbi:MAG: orotidine-5'-phosphate decarboxylase [Alistipes sp.]|jgi:orotidine-5'-phosphate decarboxylase|nr:orotidine-5'-phosphate decarboxylase [Alistipes sp.]